MGKIIRTFAVDNLRANKLYEIPFMLVVSFMLMCYNIMLSIQNNPYILEAHRDLSSIISIGVVVALLLSIAFAIYANQFTLKRRNKDFSLYGILGLEKKHIVGIILFENIIKFFIILILSVLGSYIFGQVAFLLIGKIDGFKNLEFYYYTFSIEAFKNTFLLLGFIFLILNLYSLFLVRNTSPIELLNKEKSGESEPKVKWALLIAGLISLGVAYYLALTTKNLIESINTFLIAVGLVIFGTYALFISLIIYILKVQKRSKSYYKKPSNFLTVSGMLYRMKSSATGLATVAIFLTALIITLTTTFIIYKNQENAIAEALPREFMMRRSIRTNFDEDFKVIKDKIDSSLPKGASIKDDFISLSTNINAIKDGNKLIPYNFEDNSINLLIKTVDAYNKETGQNYEIQDNQIIIANNVKKMIALTGETDLNDEIITDNSLIINDKEYKVKYIEDKDLSATGDLIIVALVPSNSELFNISNYLGDPDEKGDGYSPSKVFIEYNYSIENGDDLEHRKNIGELDTTELYLESRIDVRDKENIRNGAFLFLGIFVSLIFISGTILITYYKQISEAIEDRNKIQSMKKVGLSDSLVNKTSSSQIIIIFFLPLFVAVVHNLVASKIINSLLYLFGYQDYFGYLMYMSAITAIIAMIYLIIFKITSRVYYRIVN